MIDGCIYIVLIMLNYAFGFCAILFDSFLIKDSGWKNFMMIYMASHSIIKLLIWLAIYIGHIKLIEKRIKKVNTEEENEDDCIDSNSWAINVNLLYSTRIFPIVSIIVIFIFISYGSVYMLSEIYLLFQSILYIYMSLMLCCSNRAINNHLFICS